MSKQGDGKKMCSKKNVQQTQEVGERQRRRRERKETRKRERESEEGEIEGKERMKWEGDG